jgi:hypothetical protein
MMRWMTVTATLVAMAMLTGGCTKKVQLSVANHSDSVRTVQVTLPEETMTLGQVGANGGRLTSTVTVKTSDLPAQLQLSAGAGATNSFMVTEDTPDKLWFHITRDGKLAGPYDKKDVHVETEETGKVGVSVDQQMIVK